MEVTGSTGFVGQNAPGHSVTALFGPGGSIQMINNDQHPQQRQQQQPSADAAAYDLGDNNQQQQQQQQQGGGRAKPNLLLSQSGLVGNSTNMSVAKSYKVSDSGAMFTLGNQYHVSSSGVWEFKSHNQEPGVAQPMVDNLGIASASDSGITCNHISEIDFENGFQIGRGASGKVFNVLHKPTGTRVCVKQMMIDDAHHRDEVKRELDSLHKAPSPFVVDFYGAFFHTDLGVILLVLELMSGSLQSLLSWRRRLNERETKAIALQVVHGLNVLHSERFVIHRDIKPGNLLFSQDGMVKITDFGVSRGQRSHDPQSVHTFVGSILYMSPERLEGKSYGYECDIWSLGIALCEAITGVHPFQDNFSPDAQALTFWDLLQKVMIRSKEAESGGGEGSASASSSPLSTSIRRMQGAGVEGSEGLSVSPQMDSFVAECLAFNRDDRSSAEQLLMHPWLEDISLEESQGIVKEMVRGLQIQVTASGTAFPTMAAPSAQQQQQQQMPPTQQQQHQQQDSKSRSEDMLNALAMMGGNKR